MDDSDSVYAEEMAAFYDADNSSYIDENTDDYFTFVLSTVNLITLVIGLPVVCLALYVVYRQFRVSHVANVYVVNLLISDIIQFLGRPWIYIEEFLESKVEIFAITFFSGIVSSLGFMVCIAMERYLLIAHPHWYRSRFTLKLSVVTSVLVWLLSLGVVIFQQFFITDVFSLLFAILLLIPLPLLCFFFVGTWRGLSKTITLSSTEKKRILATLLVVIANYTFLFLPEIISYYQNQEFSVGWEFILLFLSPLLDPLLYIFIRKDTKHILEEFPCCRRSSRNEGETVSSIAVSENIRSG